MTEKYRVTLNESREESGEYRRLDAYITEEGGLMLEGYDIGDKVEAFWGDSDYEYWRHIKAEHVPIVLLELIKDRFQSDGQFYEWLKEKGIPYEFDSWI